MIQYNIEIVFFVNLYNNILLHLYYSFMKINTTMKKSINCIFRYYVLNINTTPVVKLRLCEKRSEWYNRVKHYVG